MVSNDPRSADIGVIGGTGFYSFLRDARMVRVETPFGSPSADLAVGEVAGRRIAFLPRHGARHEFAPHRVNYRANLWALRSVGVRQVLGPGAVGSLKPELRPGTFVVPDQVVDRTHGRAHTVYDQDGPPVHVAFAEPYCPRGRQAVLAAAEAGTDLVDGGTVVVVNGPRFSSRAESISHAAQGWSLVGMTAMPEASIARELALCYTAIAIVTDHDAGVDGGGGVSQAEVLEIFAGNIDRLKALLERVVARLPEPEPDHSAACPCRRALDGLELPFVLP
ncbi:MAG: 5'-methylthioadenosine phosphorylase [uncultured Propionibacteriaceae bacterium]|uniref:Purine nucleoside phosphorylase n=1 Tax=uncultured Propionibacteriaceae bacterium TaxID=257457 RepID=A0A6J4NSC0_9ACTN|nr:MAG: 5'-methylthioadenosine phosphorylase [uncultured Propionibacteriaceae bacterium]